jgi:hypothetical protein
MHTFSIWNVPQRVGARGPRQTAEKLSLKVHKQIFWDNNKKSKIIFVVIITFPSASKVRTRVLLTSTSTPIAHTKIIHYAQQT